MAFQYLAVCLFDFMVMPIATMAYYYLVGNAVKYVAWSPITLNGGGLYHVAMGAILGVAAWSRGREKIAFWEMQRNSGRRTHRDCEETEPENEGEDEEDDPNAPEEPKKKAREE